MLEACAGMRVGRYDVSWHDPTSPMSEAPAPRIEILAPQELSEKARERLIDRAYAVAAQVFDGIGRDEVAAHMVGAPAQRVRVFFFVDAQGRDVGLQCIQLYSHRIQGRWSHVFRSQAAMLPGWRGGSRTVGMGAREYLHAWLRRPWRPVYYCGLMIHPSSYSLFAQWTRGRLWPSPMCPTPPAWLQTLMELGQRFELEQPCADRPLVRSAGFATRESEAEQRYWRQSEKPAVRFYLQQVPHREQGQGLLTLVPLGPWFMAGVAARLLAARWRALWPGRRGPARPNADAVREALRRSAFFGQLSDAERQALQPRMQWQALRGGETLFRQGEAGEALYLVVQGSAYIALGSGGDNEQLVDALAPGEVLGEIALLTGQPRSATVRAAGALHLMSLGAGALQEVMAQHPALAQRLWQACARRMLRVAAWQHPLLAALSLDERDARLQAVECRLLPLGQVLTVGTLALPVRGQVQTQTATAGVADAPCHGHSGWTVVPPAGQLIEAGTRVLGVGTEPAVLAWLP